MKSDFQDDSELARLERTLFGALGQDEPSLEARRVVASALGVGALALVHGTAAASPALATVAPGSKAGALLALKWLSIGLVAGTLSAGGAKYAFAVSSGETIAPAVRPNAASNRSGKDRHRSGESAAAARPPASLADPTDDATIDRENEPAKPAGSLTRRPADAEAAESQRGPERPAVAAYEGTPPSSLAAEIALLDQVRTALARNDPTAARTRLNQYAREFPNGTLKLEARVFLVEALFLQGDAAQATALGQDILRLQGTGAHGSRIRYLLSQHQKP